MVDRNTLFHCQAAFAAGAISFLLVFFSLSVSAQAISEKGRGKLQALVDLQAQRTSGDDTSWLRQGPLNLRYGEGDDSLQLGMAGIAGSFKLTPTQQLNASAIYYGGQEAGAHITEAYWHYRPLPKNNWRQQWKLGLFHLPVSLENNGPLWTSPFGIAPSAINTWVGEELRVLGAEWRWSSLGRWRSSPWNLAGYAGVYGYNDTAGAMLTWRGWASHDRQSGWNSDYPIAELPQLHYSFSRNDDKYEPFEEVDNRPGFYLGAQADYRKKILFNYLRYDNQGDPEALDPKSAQYAWRTVFDSFGVRWQPASSWTLMGQYLKGDTAMGFSPRGVMADYWAAYVMLSRRMGPHRLSLRWDRFEVEDTDLTPHDTNDEHGHGINVSYSYTWPAGWKTTASYTRWDSERCGRSYIAGQTDAMMLDNEQWLLSLRYFWDSDRN